MARPRNRPPAPRTFSRPPLELTYAAKRADYDDLCTEVKVGLERAMATAGIRTHDISARVKDVKSLRDKGARRGWDNPLAEATDIVGARVVVLFRTDVPKAVAATKRAFEVLKEDNKSATDANSFGYAGVHLDGCLGAAYGAARHEAIRDQVFEVQVRTIVEDAWAAVSHVLQYKGRSSIPEALQRDFYALSGLFYVADQHFEMFYNQAEGAGEKADRAVAAQQAKPKRRVARPIPLDADTLAAYLSQTFPERQNNGRAGAADLIGDLVSHDIRTVRDLMNLLARTREAFQRYEDSGPLGRGDGGRFSAEGVARSSLGLGVKSYRDATFPPGAAIHSFAID